MTESAESLEIQLAEARRQRDDARRAWLAHKRLREDAEARLEAVKALPAIGPSVRRRALDDAELDESADSATGFEYGWLRAMEVVRAALSAAPNEAP